MYSENMSQADVVANASFSICAYLFSISDIDQNAYAMVFQVSVVTSFWQMTVPKKQVEASAEVLAGASI